MDEIIQAPVIEYAVGDINSKEKGSGARANGDKPKWDLMPLSQIAFFMYSLDHLREIVTRANPVSLMGDLGNFQAGVINGQELSLGAVAYNWRVQGGPEQTTLLKSLENVIRVWDYGLKKYAPFNWAKGMPWSVPMACMVRHLEYDFGQWATGTLAVDSESQELHAAHIVCNAQMLFHYEMHWKEGDDRPLHVFGSNEDA